MRHLILTALLTVSILLTLVTLGSFPSKPPTDLGFTFNFGGCSIAPPSPAAALAMLTAFYGLSEGTTGAEYDEMIIEQYKAAGYSQERAELSMARFNQCAARWKQR